MKPPFYYPRISIISISISPAHKRRETNLWQHKIKHGSGGDEVSAFWRFTTEASPQLRGLPAGYLFSCLRPASKPKAEEDEVTSAAHLRNLPSGNLFRYERDLLLVP